MIRNTPEKVGERVIIDPSNPVHGCWGWRGWHTTKGYVYVGVGDRRTSVHRLIYEWVVGPVPGGLTLDHTCRNRGCVNPRHVEPVPNRVNILRGLVPSANRAVCKAGLHDITSPGSIYGDSEGIERCRECRLESKRAYERRRRMAAAA